MDNSIWLAFGAFGAIVLAVFVVEAAVLRRRRKKEDLERLKRAEQIARQQEALSPAAFKNMGSVRLPADSYRATPRSFVSEDGYTILPPHPDDDFDAGVAIGRDSGSN